MAEDAVHIERIERIRLLMLILKIPDWLVDVVLLQQSHSVVGWTLLSPGTQVQFGNSRGLTRENVVTEILSINILIFRGYTFQSLWYIMTSHFRIMTSHYGPIWGS